MLSILVFLLVLSAGSIFAGAFFHKKFSETIPISMMGIILVLYIFGAFGGLKFGVWIVIAISFALLFLSAFSLIKRKGVRDFLTKSFGIEGVFFVIMYIALLVLNNGRLAWYNDEVSHWMDCVKAMSSIDGFTANTVAVNTLFPSYPPCMALFQYFFQKLHEIFDGVTLFCEWRPYVAFQLFSVSLFFPALGRLQYHKLMKLLFFVGTILLSLFYYSTLLSALMIDPVVGIMAGAGYVNLLTAEEKKSGEKALFISMLCAVLVLMKDVGLYFAIFIAIAFFVSVLPRRKMNPLAGRNLERANVYLSATAPLISSLCAKGSWELVLRYYKTKRSFSEPLHIGEYLRLFFIGGDTTYKQETVDKFKQAFFDHEGLSIHTGISISYFWFFLILLLGTATISFLLYRKNKKRSALLGIVSLLQTALYIFFLGAIYISKFSEIEAVDLASYDRYIRMAFLPQTIYLFLGVLYCVQSDRRLWKYGITLCMTSIVILISPFEATKQFVTRTSVQGSIGQREPYTELQRICESEFDKDDTVCYLSCTPSGYEQNLFRFIARPGKVLKIYNDPQGQIKDREWIEEHIMSGYSHVLVNQSDEKLVQLFDDFVGSSEGLQSGALYRVNRERNSLERVYDVGQIANEYGETKYDCISAVYSSNYHHQRRFHYR